MTPVFHRYLSHLSNFHSSSKGANVAFTFRNYATVPLPCKLQEVVSSSRNERFNGSYAFLLACTQIFYCIIIIIIIIIITRKYTARWESPCALRLRCVDLVISI
jgi:hypothetical protein